MDFSISVWFREKPRVRFDLKNRQFGFLCRSVVKYKKRVSWRAQLLSKYSTVLTVLSHGIY